ncbi:MAG: hypothetical protein IRY98_06100 [Alicyclobacillaceae bacterium]|nr:hypothetical protein [Alicyclobacillaceae bacterium]
MRRVDPGSNNLAEMVRQAGEWLFRAAAAGLGIMVAIQALLLFPDVRVWLVPVERLEGAPAQGEASLEEAEISLSLEDGGPWPAAYVVVNGQPVRAFTSTEVRVMVREGDTVQVDATRAQGRRRVWIDHESVRLLTPVAGLEWEVDGGRVSPVVHVHFIATNP